MNKEYVKTTDTPFAAFLMLNGYTLLGSFDEGDKSPFSGKPKIQLYLTHSDEEVRGNIHEHSNTLRDEFQSTPKSFRDYYLCYHRAKKVVNNPRELPREAQQ